ncbi:MAG: rubrerythrin [Patescibacteria group bacterium]|nr:rubrerythrin [Patescibacteria group bacterium]
MLSKSLIDLDNLGGDNRDKEIARLGMIAELDAVNLYEQLAESTANKKMKRVLLDIAREEKTHVGEFETLLLKLDAEQGTENEKAKKEVEELG